MASFKVSTDKPNVGDTISFKNSSSNATDYLWQFGDGTTSDLENPTHAYLKPDTYTVSLKAYGKGGSDKSSSDITVSSPNTIFDGVGIQQATFGDTWQQIRSLHTGETPRLNVINDTIDVYDLLVYYVSKGIVYDFVSNDSALDDSDLLFSILLVDPYIGSCNKGIYIGSKMSEAVTAYGTISQTASSSNYLGYYYFSNGIYFESDTPPFINVELIWIYPPFSAIASRVDQPPGQSTLRRIEKLKKYRFLKYIQ